MFIVKNRKVFYTFSSILVIGSVLAAIVWGFSFGIDFKGGSSVEFQYKGAEANIDALKSQLNTLDFSPSITGNYSLVPTGQNGYVLSLRTVTEPERALISALIVSSAPASSTAEIKQFNSVGPTLGAEAATKSIEAIILVILAIVIFLTFAFRKVSDPVSSWKYGVVSIVALCHDVIIPTGVFITLNHFFHTYQIDTLFVTAILVILGFSIHDTIVVFDRVRENLKNNFGGKQKKGFDEIVGESISQTFVRSINTSLTTLLAVLVVYLVGPAATKNFALVLLVGIFFGTYSSIFIGSNLLVTLEKLQNKKFSK